MSDAWITQYYQADREVIKVVLDSSVDMAQIQEFKKASSLLEALDIDKK